MSPTGVIDRKDGQGERMSFARFTAVLIGAFAFAMPALAHHPGAYLDRVMGSKEQLFQASDSPAPPFDLADADVQSKSNVTPMKDMIQFITVTTAPDLDTADVLKSYGEAHGLDPYNWMFLTRRPGDPEDATRTLSETYKVRFEPLNDGQQMHGVVTHVIDRDGRFAAKFHGLRFEPLNLVHYINGLTNASSRPSRPAEAGWWNSVKGLFR